MSPADPYAPPATASSEGFRVDRAAMPSAEQITRHFEVRQTGAVWEASFTEEVVFFSHGDDPTVIRLHRSDFVARSLLRGILASQAIIDLELPDKKQRFAFPNTAIPELRAWLGPSLSAFMGRSLGKGWVLNLVVGVLFAAALFEQPPDLLPGVSGLLLVVGALIAKLRPARIAFLLDALGWAGIVVSFALNVWVQDSSPWILLIALILVPAIIRDIRMFAFFAPPPA